MVQVQISQGLTNLTDPKSCAQTSNRLGEVLTGKRTGRVLSRENCCNYRVPTVSSFSEGYAALVVSARRVRTLRGRRPRTCTETSRVGTGRACVSPLAMMDNGKYREV